MHSGILGSSPNNLTGRFVLANSPTADNSWSGVIFGVAIYHKELTAAQVRQHYESWTVAEKPEITYDEAPVGLYLFDERGGRIVHNQLDITTDLLMPTHYFVLHPSFLAPAWRRFRYGWPGWSYWQDVMVNIVGFVPVGFLLLNYLSIVHPVKWRAATVILLGFFRKPDDRNRTEFSSHSRFRYERPHYQYTWHCGWSDPLSMYSSASGLDQGYNLQCWCPGESAEGRDELASVLEKGGHRGRDVNAVRERWMEFLRPTQISNR